MWSNFSRLQTLPYTECGREDAADVETMSPCGCLESDSTRPQLLLVAYLGCSQVTSARSLSVIPHLTVILRLIQTLKTFQRTTHWDR
ncbi:uncharacterized protein [Nothobranchius furzeri]|uniref:uncharacterized protein isoform X2 n=1 Tax=Nothobranchius furzeri TaxID=105023 RepID=UPI003904A4E0